MRRERIPLKKKQKQKQKKKEEEEEEEEKERKSPRRGALVHTHAPRVCLCKVLFHPCFVVSAPCGSSFFFFFFLFFFFFFFLESTCTEALRLLFFVFF